MGTFNLDLLRLRRDGAEYPVRSPGGLAYSLGALLRLVPGLPVRPVAWLSREDEPAFAPVLDHPRVDRTGLRPWDGPGNHVELDCREPGAKPELAHLRVPPLDAGLLEPALGCSHLLLNCTSGRDVEPAAWMSLVRAWRVRHPRGWLQMDWHSLSLDWVEGRARGPRRVPDAFRWLPGLDLLQLTLEECASLGGRAPRRLEEAPDFAWRAHKAGCRRVVVTDGPRGLLYLDAAGPRRQEAWPVGQVQDSTGCGDVLGAALLASLGFGRPLGEALAFATEMAGRVCAGAGLDSLSALPA